MRAAALLELDRYLARFPGEAGRQAAFRQQLLDDPQDVFTRANMRGHITASALVLSRDHARVLLIHHRVIGRWLQPGGHVEPGQDLWASACREVAEETGVAALDRMAAFADLPIDIDSHVIAANPGKAEGEHRHHDYLYLAVADAEAPLLAQLSEVHAVRWAPRAWLDEAGDARLRTVAGKLRTALA